MCIPGMIFSFLCLWITLVTGSMLALFIGIPISCCILPWLIPVLLSRTKKSKTKIKTTISVLENKLKMHPNFKSFLHSYNHPLVIAAKNKKYFPPILVVIRDKKMSAGLVIEEKVFRKPDTLARRVRKKKLPTM